MGVIVPLPQDIPMPLLLIEASKNGDITRVRSLLEANEAEVNQKDEYGDTALYLASCQGHTDIALALIKKGADVNEQNNIGDTALYWVSFYGHTAIALALIEKSADLNAKSKNGYTALHEASVFCKPKTNRPQSKPPSIH
jgi:ankyrin repeat protein